MRHPQKFEAKEGSVRALRKMFNLDFKKNNKKETKRISTFFYTLIILIQRTLKSYK